MREPRFGGVFFPMKEIWKAVYGFEGGYEVSNRGRVRSADRAIVCKRPSGKGIYTRLKAGRMLRPAPASHNYPTVVLGRGHTRTVHSLVAEAFIGPCPPGHEIMHKDGSRSNARADNLCYGTRSDNNRQVVLDGRRKVTVRQLRWARRRLATGERGVVAKVARKLGICESQVSNIKSGRHYAHVR